MTWPALLLSDPSPCLRWLVLRHLFGYDDTHPEVQELSLLREGDPILAEILSYQERDGSWKTGELSEIRFGNSPILATGFALTRLGFLGFDRRHPAVQKGVAYLFSQQRSDGSWPMPEETDSDPQESFSGGEETTSICPLQTALPLRGLAACGYAEEPQSEQAYEWLLEQRLDDGAWPTGIVSGVYRYVAGYRRLAHSRWGCRSNTTAALICLALHPQHRKGLEARRALDLLLGRETYEESNLGFEVARLAGAEQPRGFLTFFARYDLALILSLCSQVGASLEDERVAEMANFVRSRQGPYGLWQFAPRPQVSRWVTFNILYTLSRLDENEGWLSQEPRTPFQPYPKRKRRF